jgi:hypothetical protein
MHEIEIEKLSARRQEIWAGAPMSTDDELHRITNRLADLYEERRIAAARLRGGDRSDITRRAKVEAEIERLM